MDFWDQKFDTPDYKYGKQPNRFLHEQAMRFPQKSEVLLPGDGEGRNSVWLAEQGHRVTAMDSSALGLEAFHPKQLSYTSGGPKDESLLYTREMIQSDMACPRRLNNDPPCRFKIDPGRVASF
jgi:hypothetical protein